MKKIILTGVLILLVGCVYLVFVSRNNQKTAPVLDHMRQEKITLETQDDTETDNPAEPDTMRPIEERILPYRFADSEKLFLAGEVLPSGDELERKKKIRRTDLYGADAKMSLHVTDSSGQNVSGASVHANFRVFEASTERTEVTDENGIFIAEAKTDGTISYTVEKDGHYTTFAIHDFRQDRNTSWIDRIQDGKWLPWNPTIEVTLKEIRNPIPMYAKSIDIILPTQNEAHGFDFQIGDLVAPHGKGINADILLNCGGERPMPINQAVSRNLTISFANDNEGIVQEIKYTPSVLISLHKAPEDGYQSEIYFNYSRTVSQILENNNLPESEYLIFRTRVETDDNGKIVKSNYGKIYSIDYDITGKPDTRARVSLIYYFNPNENDHNIEYDREQNLFDQRKFGWMQP